MAAPVRYVSGPLLHQVMGDDHRRTGEEYFALGVQVGQSGSIRMAPLTERELIHIATRALDALEQLRRARGEDL